MPTIARYKIGPPIKPAITHDNGFLALGTRKPIWKDRVAYVGWVGVREGLESIQGVPLAPKNDISDALAAYKHFLDGSGTKRRISIERYVANDQSGKTWLKNCLNEAHTAVYELSQLYMTKHTSFQFYGTVLQNGFNNANFPYPETENWQKTLGGFSFWITGEAEVSKRGNNSDEYDANIEVHIEDMYNFNPSQNDIASGVPDSWNGAFSRTGLASQYINYGSITRRISWVGSPSISSTYSVKTPERTSKRGDRQPDNNRRIRNRL